MSNWRFLRDMIAHITLPAIPYLGRSRDFILYNTLAVQHRSNAQQACISVICYSWTRVTSLWLMVHMEQSL